MIVGGGSHPETVVSTADPLIRPIGSRAINNMAPNVPLCGWKWGGGALDEKTLYHNDKATGA